MICRFRMQRSPDTSIQSGYCKPDDRLLIPGKVFTLMDTKFWFENGQFTRAIFNKGQYPWLEIEVVDSVPEWAELSNPLALMEGN